MVEKEKMMSGEVGMSRGRRWEEREQVYMAGDVAMVV
jgi:hypothetical protein